MGSTIPELESMKAVLSRTDVQKGLIKLYSDSQAECIRNGKCGMEIGMSREKDICAVLKYCLGSAVNLDISNDLPEDMEIGKQKVSIKHSSGPVGTTVKAKWTSADESVKEALRSIIDADESYYSNLLLIYLNKAKSLFSIVCISAEHNMDTIKTLGEDAFKIPKGNSRGIEYSKDAMTTLIKNAYFQIDITATLDTGLDPIERRMAALHIMGIAP